MMLPEELKKVIGDRKALYHALVYKGKYCSDFEEVLTSHFIIYRLAEVASIVKCDYGVHAGSDAGQEEVLASDAGRSNTRPEESTYLEVAVVRDD